MNCNWELYELRVDIYMRGEKFGKANFLGQTLWEFFNVSLNLQTLGLSGNAACDVKIFREMVKLKTIPFLFTNEIIQSNKMNFGNLQTAANNGRVVPAAKLYVHQRNLADWIGEIASPAVLLENVIVQSASVNNGVHFVTLNGKNANAVNFK